MQVCWQDTTNGAYYGQSLCNVVHNIHDHISLPSRQKKPTSIMVAPNKNKTSLMNMIKDANLDKLMNGPMASLLKGPL
jgi:polyphosphate kinase